MKRGKLILSLLWFVWGGAILLTMVAFSTSPLFGPDLGKAWEWLIPRVLPMMALVAGLQWAAAAPAKAKPLSKAPILGTLAFSVIYLGLLSFSLLNPLSSDNPLEALKLFDLPLGAVLTLLTPAMALIFTRP